jgi:SRSO17 transposase
VCWAEYEGWQHSLLVRRSLDAKPEYAFYFTYVRKEKRTLKTLVAGAGWCWAIELAFQMAKGECGLDHCEARHWQGWYRHITLAVLTVLRAGEKQTSRQKGPSQRARNPASAHAVAVAGMARSGASAVVV